MARLKAQEPFADGVTRRPAVVAGASAGIGAEIARVLGAAGCPVALGARRVDRCEQVAEEIRAAGGEAFSAELDISDSESVRGFAKSVNDHFGEIDILVANAGVMTAGTILETDPDVFAETMNVNAVGMQRLIHEFVPAMVSRRRGDLVIISSEVVEQPRPMVGAYVASKWAVEGLARVLQMELEGTGVRASIVRPGPTASEIASGWDRDSAMKVVDYGKRFGSLRHFGYLPTAAIARTVAHVVAAPRGTHIAMSYVTPEAPLDGTGD
jgi:NADP-dependent 3-hydroxy acid dehydrogenase YdfG